MIRPSPTLSLRIGRVVALRREELRLSRAAMARRMQVTPHRLRAIELGNGRTADLERAADVLGITVSELAAEGERLLALAPGGMLPEIDLAAVTHGIAGGAAIGAVRVRCARANVAMPESLLTLDLPLWSSAHV